jgi:hypothetical protein
MSSKVILEPHATLPNSDTDEAKREQDRNANALPT